MRKVVDIIDSRKNEGQSTRAPKTTKTGRFIGLAFIAIIVFGVAGVAAASYVGMGAYRLYQDTKVESKRLTALVSAQLRHAEEQQLAQQALELEAAKKENTTMPVPGTLPKVVLLPTQTVTKIASKSVQPVQQPKSQQVFTGSLAAQQFLDQTTSSVKQRVDGSYWLEFHTTKFPNAAGGLTWYPSDETIGDGTTLPKLNVLFVCDPPYSQPSTPPILGFSFAIKNPYTCTLSLIDSRRVSREKKFVFTTGSGLLKVSGTSASTPYIREDMTSGGLLLSNSDDVPISITNLEFDISFVSLGTMAPSGLPAILRFSEGSGGTTLAEYSLESTPADPSRPSAYSRAGVQLTLPFKLNPQSQRAIFIQFLGLHKTSFDVDPNMTLVFRTITTDKAGAKITGLPATLSWTCSTKPLPNDPDRECH